MTFTETGKSGLIMLLGPSGGTYPSYIDLDTGSQSVSVNTSGLAAARLQRTIDTFEQNVVKNINYTANWNSLELSGLTIFGFGLKELNNVSGACWDVVNWASTGSIVCDGTKEIQIQNKLRSP